MSYKPKRRWAPRERRLVAEWVSLRYPEAKVFIQKRIGAPPQFLVNELGLRKADNYYKPLKRWADAIIITKEEIILVEGKIRSTPAVVGQLEYYGEIVKKTPDLAAWAHLPVRLVLLSPWVDPGMEDYCAQKGITIEHYHPPWIDEYMKEIQGYQTAEYRTGRIETEDLELERG